MISSKQILHQINCNLETILKWSDEIELEVKENKNNTEHLLFIRDVTQNISCNLFDDAGYVII